MPSHPTGVHAGKPNVKPEAVSFRSELEHQILEIQDAFCAFVSDDLERHSAIERQKQDAENRLREAERQIKNMEDRLFAVESQNRTWNGNCRNYKIRSWFWSSDFLEDRIRFDQTGTNPLSGISALSVLKNPLS